MKSQGTEMPEKILLLRDSNGVSTLRLRRNIENVANFYNYDEVEITLASRDGLLATVESHFDDFYSLGEQLEFEKTLPTESESLIAIVTALMFEVDTLKIRLDTLDGRNDE